MPKHENLFALIKSLTKSEKRYFRLFASRHVIGEQNNYLRLFDAIYVQEHYDEVALMRLFAGEKFIRHFPPMKDYLYNLILKSLRIFYSSSTIDNQIRLLIHNIEILYHKILYKQCAKELLKAKQLAYKYQKNSYLIEIIEWEKRLLSRNLYDKSSEQNLDRILKEEQSILEKINDENKFWNFGKKIFLFRLKSPVIRSQQELQHLENIFREVIFNENQKNLSYKARGLLYDALANYHYLKEGIQSKASYAYRKKIMELEEAHPEQTAVNVLNYVAGLYNFLLHSAYLRKYDAPFQKALEKLRMIPETYRGAKKNVIESINIRTFTSAYRVELSMYADTGEFEKGIKLIPDIEAGLVRYHKKLNHAIILDFYYFFSYFCFVTGDYTRSLYWLNKILNDRVLDIRHDIHSFIRIFNLIVHFELGNIDLIEYAVRSTYRFLYTRQRLHKFESLILNFIRKKLPKVVDKNQLIDEFIILKEEIKEIIKDPYEKKVLEYFDFITWLDSKIEGKPLQEVLKKKNSGTLS